MWGLFKAPYLCENKQKSQMYFLKVTEANFSILQNLLQQFEMCAYMQQMLSLENYLLLISQSDVSRKRRKRNHSYTHLHLDPSWKVYSIEWPLHSTIDRTAATLLCTFTQQIFSASVTPDTGN